LKKKGVLGVFAPIVLVLAIPPLVYFVVALWTGLSFGETASAMVEQYQEQRQNLFVVGVLGLVPLGVVAVVLWLHKRFGGNQGARSLMKLGGLVLVYAVLIWANFEYWPDFLPSRVYPGFPHGLELVIGPLFFAPVAAGVGLFAGWLVGREKGRPETG